MAKLKEAPAKPASTAAGAAQSFSFVSSSVAAVVRTAHGRCKHVARARTRIAHRALVRSAGEHACGAHRGAE